jgi:hypothetical protein
MLDTFPSDATRLNVDRRLARALTRAAAATARLDQAVWRHPLLPAFLHRVRLDAVRRQSAVDGRAIDPWQLAATIEGLRLRLDGALRIVDRGAVLDAARHALNLHQGLCEPDFDQEGDVQRALAQLQAQDAATPLLAAAAGFRMWIEAGETRAAMRGALTRFWPHTRILRAPVPLTGAAAFHAEEDWSEAAWTCTFLEAVAVEAEDWLDLLFAMERAWRQARAAAADRRRNSRAALAIDVMAATPLISATTLANALGMSIKSACVLLDEFCANGVAIEVTHRSARRLFGLSGLAPIRDVVAPPRRPEPGRGRGRPPHPAAEAPRELPPLPPIHPLQQPTIDYSALEAAMRVVDEAVRHARHSIAAFHAIAADASPIAGPAASPDLAFPDD